MVSKQSLNQDYVFMGGEITWCTVLQSEKIGELHMQMYIYYHEGIMIYFSPEFLVTDPHDDC